MADGKGRIGLDRRQTAWRTKVELLFQARSLLSYHFAYRPEAVIETYSRGGSMEFDESKKEASVAVTKWAGIYANATHVCVQTCSGLRRTAADPLGHTVFFRQTVDAEKLGDSLKEALAASRTLKPEELAEFFDLTAIEQRYESWVKRMLNEFEKTGRQHLFEDLKHCLVTLRDGQIEVRPTFHEKPEAWSGDGIGPADYVMLRPGASDREIGAGVLTALSRCK